MTGPRADSLPTGNEKICQRQRSVLNDPLFPRNGTRFPRLHGGGILNTIRDKRGRRIRGSICCCRVWPACVSVETAKLRKGPLSKTRNGERPDKGWLDVDVGNRTGATGRTGGSDGD